MMLMFPHLLVVGAVGTTKEIKMETKSNAVSAFTIEKTRNVSNASLSAFHIRGAFVR